MEIVRLAGYKEKKLMSDFERKYSKYAIPNLSLYLIIAYVV